jgi:L-2-amino-thiazoline-4-carboxylic acid hydrolase
VTEAQLPHRMTIVSTLLLYIPRAAFRHAARKHLTACFSDKAAEVWRSTLRLQSQLAASRPRHSPGVNLIVRYLEWDRALYQAVQEHGLSRSEAGILIEEINWEILGPITAASFRLSRLHSSQLQSRVRWLLDMIFLMIFTSPFRRQSLPSREDVAFDVTACPLAVYLRSQGAPELTSHAACSLDYRMARGWGMKLIRSQTIAEGASHCDFRFKVREKDSGS